MEIHLCLETLQDTSLIIRDDEVVVVASERPVMFLMSL
jgi:hypothetical protein